MKSNVKKYLKAGTIMLIILCLASFVFNGCVVKQTEVKQTEGEGKTVETTAEEQKKPIKITVMSSYDSAEPPNVDTPIVLEIEKRLNADFDINWIPTSVWDERLNVTLASGDLPMVLFAKKTPTIMTAALSGAFWEINPYLDKYNFLKGIPKVTIEGDSIKGTYYGISRLRDLARSCVTYREDWLEALGLKKPETLDEFYEMLRAFAHDDPDKNGKNDTIGFLEDGRLWIVEDLAIWLGAPNFYMVTEDGKFIPSHETKEYLEALKFIKRLYDEKILNEDFAILPKSNRDTFIHSGKVGAFFGAVSNFKADTEKTRKNDPNAKWDAIIKLGLNRTRAWDAGSLGMYVFTKSGIKTQQELEQVLAIFDKMMSDPEIVTLISYGIKDVDYVIEDGCIVRKSAKINNGNFNLLECGKKVKLQIQVKKDESDLRAEKYLEENEKNAVGNPAFPLTSQTYLEKGGDLDPLRKDAKINFIMGEIDEAGWKAFCEKWRKEGGNDVLAEYEAEYAEYAKKK
ncbi:MAG: extracellular solute-binding protein [Firmicutes bacterium]|nr:extracellular solute-binding protein [Bacillota bacterium]